MNESELDEVYTRLCRGLGEAGAEQMVSVLSRFALLAMLALDDPIKINRLIQRALVDS